MRKILFITTSHNKLGNTGIPTGCYFPEVSIAYKKFIEEGFEVDFASPKGGQIPMIGINNSDPLTKECLRNKEFIKKIENSYKISEITKKFDDRTLYPSDESFELKKIKLVDYMAIYLPGGHGTMWDLPNDKHLQQIIKEFYELGGIIGAVCHGPAALVNIKLSNNRYLIEDKRVTCYSNEEEEERNMTKVVPFLLQTKLIERGGLYSCAKQRQPNIEICERLITGQNPASTELVAVNILKSMRVMAI